MTLKRDNLVSRQVSKSLGREKFFRLQVGREEKILGTYAVCYTVCYTVRRSVYSVRNFYR